MKSRFLFVQLSSAMLKKVPADGWDQSVLPTCVLKMAYLEKQEQPVFFISDILEYKNTKCSLFGNSDI